MLTAGEERRRGLQTFFTGDTAIAKAICETCPVRAECLADALEHGVLAHGVWGGTDDRERQRLRRERRDDAA